MPMNWVLNPLLVNFFDNNVQTAIVIGTSVLLNELYAKNFGGGWGADSGPLDRQ